MRTRKTARSQPYLALVFLVAAWLMLPSPSHGQGMMLPVKPETPPLDLKNHRVETEIKHGASKTTVTQVFTNNCSNIIEATYIFPLPKNAAISDFALWINGKKKKGEILEKDEAAQIYQQIVSTLKDPGLLEYMDGKLFKARVFPIPANGDQKVQISFTQTLSGYKNLYKYVYPLKTGGPQARTKEDFTFTASLKSTDPIKSVYSPSHEVDVQFNGPKEAVIGFEENQALLDRDFILYFNVTDDRVGLSLLAHKPGSKDGNFLLMISPGAVTGESDVIDKNVTFVLDTSGSMNGEKIKGAKKALLYCLDNLRNNEKFNIIRFSSTSQQFFEAPVAPTKANKEEAMDKIDSMNAAGGTAIESALRLALKQAKAGGDLPHFIVFITDGMPTVGETDPAQIVKMVEEENKSSSKVFVFGLGDDVNANFLDLIAQNNHGAPRYAESGDRLEHVIEQFYSAVAYPAMTNVTLDIKDIKAEEIFPQKMPDLFYGEQLTVTGRYGKGGDAKIVLTGKINKVWKKITYKRSIPGEEEENEFVEHIWATRKVGYLLDQIRLNGESQELKDEVIAMARKYGIVTPYTSYLVVEDDLGPLPEPSPMPMPTPFPGPIYQPAPNIPFPAAGSGGFPMEESAAGEYEFDGFSAPVTKAEAKKYKAMDSLAHSAGSLSSDKSKGKDGAMMSEVLEDMKSAEKEQSGITRMISGKLFVYFKGRWVDESYDKDMDVLKIKFGSKAYFKLLELKPELKKIMSLGTDVVLVTAKKKAISIETGCDDDPGEKEIKKYLK
ncbi:MAG: VIT domain-containing protein [Pseudomonadota bacterium]